MVTTSLNYYLYGMISENVNILLADDDNAGCLLLKEAVEELPISDTLNIVPNGKQCIEEITKKVKKFPDVLFLDLYTSRKNGFTTLGEIKRSTNLEKLTVIICSTTSEVKTIKNVFKGAVHDYICKPTYFLQLKKVIYMAVILKTQKNKSLLPLEKFRLPSDSITMHDKKLKQLPFKKNLLQWQK